MTPPESGDLADRNFVALRRGTGAHSISNEGRQLVHELAAALAGQGLEVVNAAELPADVDPSQLDHSTAAGLLAAPLDAFRCQVRDIASGAVVGAAMLVALNMGDEADRAEAAALEAACDLLWLGPPRSESGEQAVLAIRWSPSEVQS